MTKTIPNVGDTIYATVVHGVSHAEKRLCTVTNTANATVVPDCYIKADFPEYTVNGIHRAARDWNVSDWIAVGDTVKATDIPGYRHLDGSIVTVTRLAQESQGRVYFEGEGFKDSRYPDQDNMSLAFYGAEKCDPPVDVTETILKADHDREIEALKAELTRTQERLSKAQSNYRDDMRHIESTMRDVKDEQSWCDEGTNAVIERINAGLSGGWSFDMYEQEFTLYVEVTGTMTKRVEVVVTAIDEDAAREALEDDPHSYIDDADSILTDAARHTSFDDVEVNVD